MLTHVRIPLVVTGLCWAAWLGAQQAPALALRLHTATSAQSQSGDCPEARARAAAEWSAPAATPARRLSSAAPPEGSLLDIGRSQVFAP
jgi:hypothetical protein